MEKYYLGFDAGSTYVKSALIKGDKVVCTEVSPTGIDNDKTAKNLRDILLERANISSSQIAHITATGYSRRNIAIADDTISEITAHAYGTKLTSPEGIKTSLIIDIGGQDSKIISLDDNFGVRNFTMNDKCAAGTGKFIEVICGLLETTIDKVTELSMKSKAPCNINSTCVVFAQTEVISLIAQKKDRNDILAGIHISMAKRIARLAKKYKSNGDILMTGGGAKNGGLRMAIEDELLCDVHEANYAQFNGAIGAALIAKEREDTL
ncbi:Activator of 2-hydroxyglutaryl-CoA dehydratase [Clostridium bornimense]|uniref:Activator of 2-hydroxyglutaryl-CoA dehydratase n=1 Tax=Clostridium bornimense TaxID=1216932 RepID=W6S7B0_9CLOT|nr:acyl-CoA dehydratase activase [Clostridium bornimense]CDM70297.1 Activator of 2-hydroxyglutaryl-CoA dehydratase [Clostridium bornimense]